MRKGAANLGSGKITASGGAGERVLGELLQGEAAHGKG